MRVVLAAAAVGLGLAAERAAHLGVASSAGDLIAGEAMLVCGALAWLLPRDRRVGALMAVTSVAWFAGDVWPDLVYAHRGPLVHLLLSYPDGRLTSRPAAAVTAAAYVDGLVFGVGDEDVLTVAVAAAVIAAALWRYRSAGGAERRARLAALLAVTGLAAVLGVAALARLAGADAGRTALWTYDAAVALVAVGLLADLRSGRWSRAAVTNLVLDLGALERPGSLRARLARTLGDPRLLLGYRLPTGDYVDEEGRPLTLPPASSDNTVITIEDDGEPIAALVHDAAVPHDPELVDAIPSVARLAVTNARMQGEARAVMREVELSSRRIVGASDAQCRRLQQELRDGAELRLAEAEARLVRLVAEHEPLGELMRDLRAAREDLRRFAQGLHPDALTAAGLRPALCELAARSAVPATVAMRDARFPAEVEDAAYFLCSEALTNVAKHARASTVRIRVAGDHGRMVVTVEDDGAGGADPVRGSGLRGLADRIEALGGRLGIESPSGAGTRLVAQIPLER